jgi:protein-S-isoprenylcysteine O-methyltransferase Ste14
MSNNRRSGPARGALLALTRVWLPLAIAVAGVVLIAIGGTRPALLVEHEGSALSGIGVALLIVALIVWMLNWMFRLSVQSNRDREREEDARKFFDRHGRWPDEP